MLLCLMVVSKGGAKDDREELWMAGITTLPSEVLDLEVNTRKSYFVFNLTEI